MYNFSIPSEGNILVTMTLSAKTRVFATFNLMCLLKDNKDVTFIGITHGHHSRVFDDPCGHLPASPMNPFTHVHALYAATAAILSVIHVT